MGRWKKMTFKNLIFGKFWGPEVVGSSSYQTNIGKELTHLNCDNRLLWSTTKLATLFLAQDCANKNVQTVSKKNIKPYLKQAIEGANMVRAPKWTAAIFQKRIEDASKCMLRANLNHGCQTLL